MKDIKSVLNKAKRSKIVKEAKKGHDEKAEKRDGDEETAKKVMGPVFWKQRVKASKKS